MADGVETAGWYQWCLDLFVPRQYQFICHLITGFFMVLGLALIGPLILLVIYDLLLWAWRLSGANQLIDVLTQRPPAQTESPPPPLNGNGNKPPSNGGENKPASNGHATNSHPGAKKTE
ncbi:hypothetical protein QBC35DRAFT_53526 [Podospora australis]|uniref:Uncharacterized protein n=1 Tax=Podospora australis TaxID=1536484 RepID=A0AAN7AJ99_9PEZI|nr:hypothetical protein QBC35DRAFT_53526 [Podospora australis]